MLRLTSFCRTGLLVLSLSIPILAGAAPEQPDFSGVARLVERRIPFLAGKVDFRPASDAAGSCDAFTLSARQGRLTIEASSSSAAATAVNYYLNHYCGMSLSHNGDNLHDLPSLPEVVPSVTVRSPFRYRYALNYCTYNYTYSFYDWNDWERELDWMALNGVNLMLAPLGTELIWARTLEDAGFTEEEIGDFIPGPAFTAWWLMGNLEGWGGPMSHGKPGPDAAAYPGTDGRTGYRTRIAGLLGHGSQQAPGEIPRRPDRRSGTVGPHLPPPRDPAPRRPALRPDGRPLLLRPAGTLRRLSELPRRRPLPRGRRYDRDARDPHSVVDPGLHAAAFPRIEMDAPGMERQSEEGTARRARPGIDRGHRPLRGERFDVAKHRGVLRHPGRIGSGPP